MRRAVMSVLGTAFAAVLVAGCSDDPEVREPDPRPTSATAADVKVPGEPPQLGEDSQEGAAAQAYYWVDLLNYTATSGDADDLLALSERCKECRDFAVSARDLATGERPSEDTWTIDDVSVMEREDSTDVTVGITLLGGEQTEVVFRLTADAPFEITELVRYES